MNMSVADISVANPKQEIRKLTAGRKMLCARGVFSVYPNHEFFMTSGTKRLFLHKGLFTARQLEALCEHLNGYEKQALLIDCDDKTCVCLPGLYPSSSLGIALLFDVQPLRFWRIARECGAEDMIVQCKGFPEGHIRMTGDMRLLSAELGIFFEELRSCFFELDRLNRCINSSDIMKEIEKQCNRISYFAGCPVRIVSDSVLSEALLDKIDFSLLTAFVLTMLMAARKKAPRRSCEILLTPTDNSVTVSVTFKLPSHTSVEREVLRWRHISNDKNMLFDVTSAGDTVTVRFNPCRAEWSLLGIKQELEEFYFDMFD